MGNTDSDIFTPILVKKSLNSLAMSVGFVIRVPFFFIFSIFCVDLLRFAASLKVYSSHLNWGVRRVSFDPLLNTRCPASLKIFF